MGGGLYDFGVFCWVCFDNDRENIDLSDLLSQAAIFVSFCA
jgi:hypothetical protein